MSTHWIIIWIYKRHIFRGGDATKIRYYIKKIPNINWNSGKFNHKDIKFIVNISNILIKTTKNSITTTRILINRIKMYFVRIFTLINQNIFFYISINFLRQNQKCHMPCCNWYIKEGWFSLQQMSWFPEDNWHISPSYPLSRE